MRRCLISCWVLGVAGGIGTAAASEFEGPVRMKGGDDVVRVEAPGWAAPCLADIDRDGKPDLLVGQFADGKIRVYKGLGAGKFAPGSWLQAEGEVAHVPGVW